MRQHLLLAISAFTWSMFGHGETLPAIRVYPSAVETGTVYQSAGPDLIENLEASPDIYVQSNGYMGQMVSASFRGLSNPHTLVLLDGISINDVSAGQADLSRFDRTGADQVTVLSGPEVLLQSSQAGGIIQLNTHNTKSGTKISVAGGSFDTAMTTIKSNFSTRNSTHTILANHEQTAGLPKYGSARIYGERNRYHQENGGLVSHIGLGERTWIRTHARALSSVLKYDDGGPPLPLKPQATQNSAIYLLGAEANHESQDGKWHQQLSTSHAKQNMDYDVNSFAHTQESTAAYRHDLKWSWAHRTRVVADTTRTSLHNSLFRKQQSVSGLAALHGLRITDTWNMEVGIRQDHTQKYSMPARLTAGLAWEKDRTKLYGSWRQAMRLPTLYNQYAQTPSVQPNPSLKSEKMDLSEFGWQQKLGNRSTMQLVYFYNRLHNMMIGSPINNITSTTNNLPGISVLQGTELSTQYTWDNDVSLRGSYTYTSSRYAKGSHIKPIAPKHRIHILGAIPITSNWSMAPSLEYVSQRFNMNHGLPAYVLGNLEVTYTIKPGYQLYGQIKNIWDERYEVAYGFRTARRAFYVGTRLSF